MQTDPLTTRRIIVDLFDSQLGAARALHFSDRAVRWWCQHGAPPHILYALTRLHAGEISLSWARHLLRAKRTRRRKTNGRNRRRA